MPHHDATDPSQSALAGAQLVPTSQGEWRLSLNAPGLGNMRIDLGLQGHGLDAHFWVGNPGVKSTVEAGLTDLRGALQASGLNLGQLGVSVGGGRRDDTPPEPGSPVARNSRIAAVGARAPRARPVMAGLVDVLA